MWIVAPGRIGFKMSTQRRASRTTAATKTGRAGVRRRSWFSSDLTAPLMSIIRLAWAWVFSGDEGSPGALDWVATDSLLSDHHYETLAWPDSRSGSPPGANPATKICRRAPRCLVGSRGPSSMRVTHRSSLRHDPILPVRAHLHTTLPIAPAGEVRWAERHDGKRDLYFQHAA